MKKHRKPKDFLQKPQYPGGKKALIQFIKDNLEYPKEALKKGIQGKVWVYYEISGKGEIIKTKIIKGLGYGCDEEAIRLVEMLKYKKAKNRGVKLHKIQSRIGINFSLKKVAPKPKPPVPKKQNQWQAHTTMPGFVMNYQIKPIPSENSVKKEKSAAKGTNSKRNFVYSLKINK